MGNSSMCFHMESDSLELCSDVDACHEHLWLMAGYHVYVAMRDATCLVKCQESYGKSVGKQGPLLA